jgi:hypothetical protein
MATTSICNASNTVRSETQPIIFYINGVKEQFTYHPSTNKHNEYNVTHIDSEMPICSFTSIDIVCNYGDKEACVRIALGRLCDNIGEKKVHRILINALKGRTNALLTST